MVSVLWSACAEGRLEDVNQLLVDATPMDVELKDPTGLTPLIVAVQNGHVDVVRALLDKGADPLNASHQGPPMNYTTEPAIIELLRNKIPEDKIYPADVKPFYPSPASYTYYPQATLSLPEGAVYYPPPTPGNETGANNGPGNLPPPDIAKMIPCRYFPACRYGASCMFAHPQGPYFPSPVPPSTQYPTPYDPVNPQQYPTNYYPIPYPQNAIHQIPSAPAPTTVAPGQSPPEANAPPPQPFNGAGLPYPPLPPTMTSPTLYPHAGRIPGVPQIPSLHQQAAGPQSQALVYGQATVPAFLPPTHSDSSPPYPPAVPYPGPNGAVPGSPLHSPSQPDPSHRDNTGSRRGTGRRLSNYGRKPPCLFFPSGKCKNGDDCRFPHVLPDPFQNRATRTRGIEDKFNNMSLRDDSKNTSRSQSSEAARPRYQGPKGPLNGHHQQKRAPLAKQQRVPNADDFPVLSGTTTPGTNRPTANSGQLGPTAAQVLQAPAPARSSKENRQSSDTNGSTTPSAPDVTSRLPISFAAAATGPVVSDVTTGKEVSVSA